MEPQERYRNPNSRPHSGIVPGMILVGIGALFFLHNLHIVYIQDWVRYWPAILIAFGIVKLVDSPFAGGRTAGGVLVGLGAILLAQTLGYLDGLQMRDMWPLFLIGLGVLLLFKRGFEWKDNWGDRVVSSKRLDAAAVFGGGKRKVVSENFEGGTVSAVFGGFELDLRKANMAADSAVLSIDAIFGGAEIKIPETWDVVIQTTSIFGGFSDSTVHPSENAPARKTLVLTGSAIFGGCEVKN